MHKDEFNNMYYKPKCFGELIKKNEMVACRTYGGMRSSYWVLVRKPKGKIPFGIPRRRWEDNIKINFQELIWGGEAWTGSI